MAFNYQELDAITNRVFLPLVQSQVFLYDPLMDKIKDSRKTVSGGTKFTQAIKVDNLAHGKYQANATGNVFDITEKSIINAVDYTVGGHYSNLTLDNYVLTKNKAPAAIFDLMKEKTQDMAESLRIELLQALYGAPATYDPTGLGFQGFATAIDDKNVYAGLDRSAVDGGGKPLYKFWRSQIYDNVAGFTLTYESLRKLFMAATAGGADSKGLIWVGDYGTINAIENILSSRNQITTVNQEAANLGFSSFTLFGKPVYASSEMEAAAEASGKGTLYAVNMDYFSMRTMENADFTFTPFKTSQNNDTIVKQMKVMGNYVCSKPMRMGSIRDIILP